MGINKVIEEKLGLLFVTKTVFLRVLIVTAQPQLQTQTQPQHNKKVGWDTVIAKNHPPTAQPPHHLTTPPPATNLNYMKELE